MAAKEKLVRGPEVFSGAVEMPTYEEKKKKNKSS